MPQLPKPLLAWLAMPWPQRSAYLKRKFHDSLPGATRIESPDRTLLESRLLGAYAADGAVRRLLFVGCEWYTQHYADMFAPDSARFCTIDIDPDKARFGGRGHVVAPMQEVDRHFPRGSMDVVVCNGVYGFGIDDWAELGRAFAAAHAVLREGGTLVLGWNDVKALAPFDPAPLALERGFGRAPDSPLGAWRVATDTPLRHTFDAYERRS